MTDEEAGAMLKELGKHYGERVAPVSEYCTVFREFFEDAGEYLKDCYGWTQENFHGLKYQAIGKSSYLARRLYGGEKRRTVPCPTHNGKWSGLPLTGDECPCDLTGWLPAEERR